MQHQWQPVGPGEFRPDEITAEVEVIMAQCQTTVLRGSNRSGESEDEDQSSGGVFYQRCGGGRRVVRKKLGGG